MTTHGAWLAAWLAVSDPSGEGGVRGAEVGRPASVAAHAGVALRRVDTREPVVALTFDACATATNAFGFDELLYELLRREALPATVFLGGRWIEKHPAAAHAIAALPQVELGNHSYAHPPFSSLSRVRIAREIDRTEARIRDLGRSSVGFRPPFGDWGSSLLAVAGARRLPVVLWDVVSGDAGGHLLPRTMVRQTMQGVQPGSIVIFHINGRGPHTHEALPEILRQLGQRGLRPVRLSQLLALADARVVPAQPARYRRHVEIHETAPGTPATREEASRASAPR
jgi:peptidoglycan/xylan/chitin deacetylase (PgdA/CDA1 family)